MFRRGGSTTALSAGGRKKLHTTFPGELVFMLRIHLHVAVCGLGVSFTSRLQPRLGVLRSSFHSLLTLEPTVLFLLMRCIDSAGCFFLASGGAELIEEFDQRTGQLLGELKARGSSRSPVGFSLTYASTCHEVSLCIYH